MSSPLLRYFTRHSHFSLTICVVRHQAYRTSSVNWFAQDHCHIAPHINSKQRQNNTLKQNMLWPKSIALTAYISSWFASLMKHIYPYSILSDETSDSQIWDLRSALDVRNDNVQCQQRRPPYQQLWRIIIHQRNFMNIDKDNTIKKMHSIQPSL